jgi:peroxiredoxin
VPSLVAFQREMGPQGVVVLGVSVDTNKELYNRFIDQYGVNFETSRDPDWNVAASYGTFQLPETYVIDSSGRVVEKIIGIRDWMDPGWLAGVRRRL